MASWRSPAIHMADFDDQKGDVSDVPNQVLWTEMTLIADNRCH